MEEEQSGQGLVSAQAEELSQQSVDSEEDSLEDELMPRPAFQIEENNDNLTEEEKLAFSYILSVRTQKQSLVQSRKKQRLQGLKFEPEVCQMDQQQLKAVQEGSETDSDKVWTSLEIWRAELISNWRCVIANMQYLHKNKSSNQPLRQKLGLECLFQKPEVKSICNNQWLTLPQIQYLLIFLSNAKYEALEHHIDIHQEMPPTDHYHLWIYSLLALHQSYASYCNFEALASINACLQKEADYFEQRTSQSDMLTGDRMIHWATTLVILVQGFNQKFLQRRVGLVKMIK